MVSQPRRGQTVRHKDTGIVGHLVSDVFRARINPDEPQQRDFVSVRWSGGGLVTDEPAYAVEVHEVAESSGKIAA
jgi:hypothetical protein